MMRSLALATIATALTACGSDTWIVVQISATCGTRPCAIPSEVDGLSVRVTEPDTARELRRFAYTLDAGHSFPIEIVEEPSDQTPKRLQQEVLVTSQGIAQARRAVVHPWSENEINEVRIGVSLP